MTTEVSSEQILLETLRPILYAVRPLAKQCEQFNALPNIPWRQREMLRSIQGKLENIDQHILDSIDARWAENSQTVEAFIEELWGEAIEGL